MSRRCRPACQLASHSRGECRHHTAGISTENFWQSKWRIKHLTVSRLNPPPNLQRLSQLGRTWIAAGADDQARYLQCLIVLLDCLLLPCYHPSAPVRRKQDNRRYDGDQPRGRTLLGVSSSRESASSTFLPITYLRLWGSGSTHMFSWEYLAGAAPPGSSFFRHSIFRSYIDSKRHLRLDSPTRIRAVPIRLSASLGSDLRCIHHTRSCEHGR